MRRGVNALLFTAALASAGCVTDSGKLDIRPIADPYSKATNAGNPAVAEGRGLLAVGSVGLAIEAFRKALREQPDSIEALAGLAECYDQMGRHDLSRAKYEAALAIAPNNVTLLRTFAASLERQGRYAEAIALRSEASQTERTEAAALLGMAPAAPALVPAKPQATPKAAPLPRFSAAPTRLAAVQPIPAPAKAPSIEREPASMPVKSTEVLPKPAPAPAKPAEVRPEPAPAPIRIADALVALTSTPVVSQVEWRIEAPASVTVKLPPAMPARAETPKVAVAATPPVAPPRIEVATPPSVAPPKVAEPAVLQVPAPRVAVASAPLVEIQKVEIATGPSVTVKLPPARPAAIAPPKVSLAEAIAPKAGPRLERLSLAEVALVTDSRPRWRTEAVRYATIAAPPRFVPIAELRGNGGLRLLNAARQQGLAARTRLVLNQHGWNGVTIGDYGRVREKSLVLYSEKTERAARKLAAKYGIWIAKEARPGPLTILLGRDWVTRRQARG